MALSPREKVLGTLTIVTVFACANFFAVGPALAKWREAADQMEQAKFKIKEARNLLAREPGWQAEHKELLARLRRSSDAGSTELISRMEELGGQFGLSFTQRTPSPPVDRQRYVEKTGQFTFQTQWPNFVKFLYALTKQTEIFRVTTMRLRADQKDPNQLAGDMTIVTYYQPAGAAPAKPAATAQNPVDKPATGKEDKPAKP